MTDHARKLNLTSGAGAALCVAVIFWWCLSWTPTDPDMVRLADTINSSLDADAAAGVLASVHNRFITDKTELRYLPEDWIKSLLRRNGAVAIISATTAGHTWVMLDVANRFLSASGITDRLPVWVPTPEHVDAALAVYYLGMRPPECRSTPSDLACRDNLGLWIKRKRELKACYAAKLPVTPSLLAAIADDPCK